MALVDAAAKPSRGLVQADRLAGATDAVDAALFAAVAVVLAHLKLGDAPAARACRALAAAGPAADLIFPTAAAVVAEIVGAAADLRAIPGEQIRSGSQQTRPTNGEENGWPDVPSQQMSSEWRAGQQSPQWSGSSVAAAPQQTRSTPHGSPISLHPPSTVIAGRQPPSFRGPRTEDRGPRTEDRDPSAASGRVSRSNRSAPTVWPCPRTRGTAAI